MSNMEEQLVSLSDISSKVKILSYVCLVIIRGDTAKVQLQVELQLQNCMKN